MSVYTPSVVGPHITRCSHDVERNRDVIIVLRKMAEKQARIRGQLAVKGKAGSFEHNENVTTKEEGETRGLLLGFMGEMIHRDTNMSVKQTEVITEAMTRASTLTSPSTEMGEEYDEVVVKIGRDLAGIARDMSRRGEEEVDAVVSDLLGTPSLAYKMFVRVAARIVEWNETGIGEFVKTHMRE